MAWTMWKKGLAALGLAGLAAGGVADARAPATPRPALWKVADHDTTIYLFGTIHLLPRGFNWQSPAFDAAAAHSDSLVVETIIDSANPAALQGTMMTLALRDGLPPVEERVSPDMRPALARAIARSGANPAGLGRLETWAIAFTLLGSQFRGMDLQREAGVEAVLKERFTAAGKPIGQLETHAEQLGFFDLLPERAQRSLLEGAIAQPEAARRQFDSMANAWAHGDVDRIARVFDSEFRKDPRMRELLIERRNANWAAWIERRLEQPGSAMVAVGAGHLAGRQSVQAMLGRRGLRVTRIQ